MVTNSANAKLSGICVTAVPAGQAIPLRKFGPFRVTYKGKYDVGPLSPGTYDIQFEDCFNSRYATQWYHGSDSEQAATSVTVSLGSTTSGINAVMTTGGSISGQVTDGSLRPLQRICVTATDAAAQSYRATETNSAGHYTIRSLATGTYQVTFADCNYVRHVQAGTDVRSVQVTAPRTALVNEKLAPAGTISGTVRGGSAATLQSGACVIAVPFSPGDAIGSTETGGHGNYRLTDLAPGKYQVYFGDPFCLFDGGGYAPQWYNNQSAQATATTVTVPPGGDVSNISATLGSDGAISGVVIARPHTAVAGECVTAVPVNPTPDPMNGDTQHDAIAVTAADGSYTLAGLLPGQYQVEFSTGCGDTGFQTQWWKDAVSASAATTITVPASTTVPGINAKLQH